MTDTDSASTSESVEQNIPSGSEQSSSPSGEPTVGSPIASSYGRRTTLRPRNIASIQADADKRRRKNLKPEKRRFTECLETIFEEPVTNKKGEVLLTGRKLKRSITFSDGNGEEISKGKLRKRRERIKKKLGNSFKTIKKLNQIKSVNMNDIRCKLNLLDIDEPL